MSNSYHWDRPPPGRTEHTWQAGQDKDNLQGHKLPDPLSTCPGGPAWCAAPAGCRSRWGPPGQSGGPARWGSSASASSSVLLLLLTWCRPSLHFFQIFFSSISRQTSISLPMHLIWLLNLKSFLSFQYHFSYCPIIIILWCILLIRNLIIPVLLHFWLYVEKNLYL